MPVCPKPIQEKARTRLRTLRQFGTPDQVESKHVEPPRARPSARVAENRLRMDLRHDFDPNSPRLLTCIAHAPSPRHLSDQPMQADRLHRYRRVALIRYCLAIDKREGAQCGDRFVKPSSTSSEASGSRNFSRPSENRNSGIGSGARSAA